MTASGPILVIEDEARNSALLEAILRPAGYDLQFASDLDGARAWLRDGCPSLILLDRHLPDGDGLDLAREVKGSVRLAAVPVLLVSASVLPVDREAATLAGCDGFIDKPVRVASLLQEVARRLAD